MKHTSKLLVSIVLAMLFYSGNSFAIDCTNVMTYSGLLSAVADCSYLEVKGPVRITGRVNLGESNKPILDISPSDSFTGGAGDSLKVISVGDPVPGSSGIFDHYTTFTNIRFNKFTYYDPGDEVTKYFSMTIEPLATARFVDVRFANDSMLPVISKPNSVFICNGCDARYSIFPILGKAYIDRSRFTTTWNLPALAFTGSESIISNSTFELQRSSSVPYIIADNSALEIKNNAFAFKGPVIRIEGLSGAILAGNIYISDTDGVSPDPFNIFSPLGDTKMARMERPKIEYKGYDSKYYYVKIDNDFAENETGGHWGGEELFECTKKFSRDGIKERSLNFETYIRYGRGLYPLGYAGYELRPDGEKIVKIEKSAVRNKLMALDRWTALATVPEITLLVHCEGLGTTNFAAVSGGEQVLRLARCADGKMMVDGSCVPACEAEDICSSGYSCIYGVCQACMEDASCGEGMICRDDGKCDDAPNCASTRDCDPDYTCESGHCTVIPPPPPECVDSLECISSEVCLENKCVPPPPVACSTDSECGAGNYCDTDTLACKACEGKAVELVCPGGGSIMADTSLCEGDTAPICPVNSEASTQCGSMCVCKEGYKPLGNKLCVGVTTGSICGLDESFDTKTQTCIKASTVGGFGRSNRTKGGCSLIVQ